MTMSRTVAVPGSGRWRREPGTWSSMLPSVMGSGGAGAQTPPHEPKPNAQALHQALQATVYSGPLLVRLPSRHAFRTMPTFLARISQQARDACAIVSLVPIRQGCRPAYHPDPCPAGVADRRDAHAGRAPAVARSCRQVFDRDGPAGPLRGQQCSAAMKGGGVTKRTCRSPYAPSGTRY
jgi:hypothetical protein